MTLKDTLTKKIRLRVTGYSQGAYYYVLSKRRLLMQYKTMASYRTKTLLLELVSSGHEKIF